MCFTHLLPTIYQLLPTFYPPFRNLYTRLFFFTHVLRTSLFFTHVLPTQCCSTNLPWEIIGSWWRFSIHVLPTFYPRSSLGAVFLPTFFFYPRFTHYVVFQRPEAMPGKNRVKFWIFTHYVLLQRLQAKPGKSRVKSFTHVFQGGQVPGPGAGGMGPGGRGPGPP